MVSLNGHSIQDKMLLFVYLYKDLLKFNTSSDMPTLGYSNSAVNKDLMSEIRTNGDPSI